MTDQLEEIKKRFVENTLSELSSLREELAEVPVQDNGNEEKAQKVFMTMHGICGTAPVLGFEHLVPMSRKMERVFDQIRKGEGELSDQIKVQTLRGIDFIINDLQGYRESVS
ncbi:MAG: Hpt domain-containing protein [Bacteroidota bacterium]